MSGWLKPGTMHFGDNEGLVYGDEPYIEKLTRYFVAHEDHARKCQMACQDMLEAIEDGFPGLVAPYVHELISKLPKEYIK